jgi:PAS domain S-box-containing protein
LRLSEFVRANHDRIIGEWAAAIRNLRAAEELSRPALLDHLPDLVDRLADSMQEVADGHPAQSLESIPDAHAIERLDSGFELKDVVGEYLVLRSTIQRLWEEAEPERRTRKEISALDTAIDQAVARSVERYTHARDRTLRALNRISTAALASEDVAAFLPKLLQVLMETTEAVDAAAILLIEERVLRLRATAGLEREAREQFSLAVGQGFAGTIAATGRPLELEHAATNPLLVSEMLRGHKIRALYGVPLLKGSEVVGVAHMGSRTAFRFSEEDKILFRVMADRAAAFIVQGQTLERERLYRQRAEESERARAELLARERAATAEAQHRAAELEAVLASIPEAIYVGDMSGIKRTNAMGVAQLGFDRAEELDRSIAAITERMKTRDPGTGRRLRAEDDVFTRALGGEAVTREVLICNARTGEDRVVRSSAAPIIVGGEVIGAIAINVDLTEQKRVEQDLRDQKERFQQALDATHAGVFERDLVTGAVTWDARTKALFGMSPDAEVTYDKARAAMHPDDRARVTEAVAAATDPTRRTPYQIEYRIVDPNDGRVRWLMVHGRCFFSADGHPRRIVGTVLDITDRKTAEEELQRTATFREQFISILGHDLRNPLSAILVSAQGLARSGNLSEAQRRSVGRIGNSAEKMNRMISDVLDFARGRLGGGFVVKREPVNLHEVCDKAIEELLVAHPKRRIELLPRGDGRGCWDPDRLAQVVSNLLGNAITYGDHASPIIVEARDLGEEVSLEVTNRGQPIPPEIMPVLFEPFTRAGTDPGSTKSLGLGLYIVKQIVEAHGGRIEVRSTAADETTFSVKLPRGT